MGLIHLTLSSDRGNGPLVLASAGYEIGCDGHSCGYVLKDFQSFQPQSVLAEKMREVMVSYLIPAVKDHVAVVQSAAASLQAYLNTSLADYLKELTPDGSMSLRVTEATN